jgi:hypothetical protein
MRSRMSPILAHRAVVSLLIVASVCGSVLAYASRSGHNYTYKDDQDTSVVLSLYLEDTNMAVIRGAYMEANPGLESKFCKTLGWVMISKTLSGTGAYNHAAAVFRGLDAWAALDGGRHPEFRYIPFIVDGCSSSGSSAYALAMYGWQRCIAFGVDVGAGYNPANPTDSMIHVPGMFTVGDQDTIVGPRCNPQLDTLIAHVRPRGALWSHAYIWGMGHQKRRVMHMFASFYEKMIHYSYPDSVDPRTGPVHLRRPTEASGWLADPSTWRSNFTVITPYASYVGDKGKAEWLSDEDIAWLYRGYSSTDTRLALHTRDTTVDNDFLSWWMLNLYKPGDKVDLIVDTTKLPNWTKIELYRGCTLVDSIKRGQALGDTMKFSEIAPATPVIQAYNLMGYDNTARKYPSILYSVVVIGNPPVGVRSAAPWLGFAHSESAPLPQHSLALYTLSGQRMSFLGTVGKRQTGVRAVLVGKGNGSTAKALLLDNGARHR